MSRFRRNIGQQKSGADISDGSSVPKALLQQARKTGQLNLSNREFKEVPEQVWKLNAPPDENSTDFSASSTEKWWDQVELSKLILASNQLTTLSDSISVFPALTVLDLHDNKLTELPNALSSLAVLEKFDVSHNQLKCLPEGICNLERMGTILIQHNQLCELPANFCDLRNLRVLDASNNQIQSLPNGWGRVTDLQKINLSHNHLTILPDDICSLPILSFLDLSHNKISQLPREWGNLSSLKELYLRHNAISEIPDLNNCSNLKELYLARNELATLNFSHLPVSLVVLEARDNRIKEITDDVTKLKDLQRLDLANNDISTLPPKMGLMEQLKALNIDGNPMRGIRRDIVNKGTLAIIQYLRTRIVDKGGPGKGHQNGTSSLPVSSEIAERTKIHAIASTKTLDLTSKPWSPNLIEDFNEIPIEVLLMSRMDLRHFPNEITQFQASLKTLNLSLNKLTTLGSEIGGFVSLTHLNLSTNMLTTLPSEIGELRNLIELNIMQNRFTALPECIFTLLSLEHLLAGGNQIAKIDAAGLRKLPKLSTLAVQNNSIAQVPPELALISSLKNLQLEGNIFKIPRQNILQQGTAAVLDYLKGRVPNK